MLTFSYDENNDVLEIEGVKYAGDLFRMLTGGPISPNEDLLLKIVKNENGLVTFRSYHVIHVMFEEWHREHEKVFWYQLLSQKSART